MSKSENGSNLNTYDYTYFQILCNILRGVPDVSTDVVTLYDLNMSPTGLMSR
jgi:hypothetical protein